MILTCHEKRKETVSNDYVVSCNMFIILLKTMLLNVFIKCWLKEKILDLDCYINFHIWEERGIYQYFIACPYVVINGPVCVYVFLVLV